MEIRISSRRPHVSYTSDFDGKETSDDDDDRNHKHRRRDGMRSQLLEDEITGHLFTNPYITRSKPFLNGHLSMKFDQKEPELTRFSTVCSNLNQKIRVNQPISSDHGAMLTQMVHQSSVPHNRFVGTGLTTVDSNVKPRGPFGVVPGLSNGGPDMFHPFGLQGTYKPAINSYLNTHNSYLNTRSSYLNTRLARQQCRDFEEQGFCLKGDMCPMEHGMNRIVVEDVQSLSLFNLPISVASANLSIEPVETGPTNSTSVLTNKILNRKESRRNIIKYGTGDIDSSVDFYDPDQPLWSNDSHTLTEFQSTNQTNAGKTDSLLDRGLSGDHRVGQSDGLKCELLTSNGTVTSLKTRSSVQGRKTFTKKRTEIGENPISNSTLSNLMQNETASNGTLKMNNLDSSLKIQSRNGRINRNRLQKAESTLFVNGIPHQNNKKKLLLTHFKKFGDVFKIHIPLNSKRAFVQFSKREEAEAALMSPDAVMSNRFIKLWWANRDIIRDIHTTSGHNMSKPPHDLKNSSVNSVAKNKRNDDFQSKLHNCKDSHALVSEPDHPKPLVVDGKKVISPFQKKLESLELLKEELRKKQEMLDKKRNDFRRELDKLEKHATGPKGEISPEQLTGKQKLGDLTDSIKAATPSGGDRDVIVSSAQYEVAVSDSKSVGPARNQSSKTNLAVALQESSRSKSSSCSLVNLGSPVGNSRFKLDNRSTAFKVVSPLPDGLADVPVLTEHFSHYGDLSKVQVDEFDPKTSNVTAHIYFTTRDAAEKAFLGGKSWKGHNLQFVWLISSDSRKDDVVIQTSSRFVKDSFKTTSEQPYTSRDGDSEENKGKVCVSDDT